MRRRLTDREALLLHLLGEREEYIQQLIDENARLKGEKGKPKIKPSRLEPDILAQPEEENDSDKGSEAKKPKRNEATHYLKNHQLPILSAKLVTVNICRFLTFPMRFILNIWRLVDQPRFWQLFSDSSSRGYALDLLKAIISAFGLVATIFAGFGLLLTYYGAQEDRKEAREDRRLVEQRLLTDRFSKAVEQLGNEKDTVRIGGIYALEGLTKDSPKYQWIIMEILTSFIRRNSPLPLEINELSQDERQKSLKKLSDVSIDVQAALTVIRRREPKQDNFEQDSALTSLDLSLSHLGGVNLSDTNLEVANLFGANLTRADLPDTNLEGANLFGANLEMANLRRANLKYAELEEANFTGADIRQADFGKARHLTAKQVKSACFWDQAKFDWDVLEELKREPDQQVDCEVWTKTPR